MQKYDTIVLGLGGMGSAALFQLACRGQRVLGLEQFPLVHDRGSSHGQSRIIRTAYYEHPSYVPLVRRSFDLWRELQSQSGQTLLTMSPCLSIGSPAGELVLGVQQSAHEHHLQTETLSHNEIIQRFPAFQLDGALTGILEQEAGILAVEKCVQAHLDQAKQSGAEIRCQTPVVDWTASDTSVTVRTSNESFTANNLIITAGAWSTKFLADIGVQFSIMRQTMHWFRPANLDSFGVNRFPLFLLDTPGGAFYGLPAIDSHGVKIARHYGAPELARPEEVKWELDDADVNPVKSFLSRYIPTAIGPSIGQVCMYTLTPDRHFVIDRHPRFSNVAIAAGFSGHGFKFAPIVGEILADLVDQGRTKHDISLFRANRFKLR